MIKSGWFYFPDIFWSGVSADAKDVITLMLDLDPNSSPTARKLLKHRYLPRLVYTYGSSRSEDKKGQNLTIQRRFKTYSTVHTCTRE